MEVLLTAAGCCLLGVSVLALAAGGWLLSAGDVPCMIHVGLYICLVRPMRPPAGMAHKKTTENIKQ